MIKNVNECLPGLGPLPGEGELLLQGGEALNPPGSGSVSQRYGSEDPDPYKNVTDSEH